MIDQRPSREKHSSQREEQGSVPGGCEGPEGPAWLKAGGSKGRDLGDEVRAGGGGAHLLAI